MTFVVADRVQETCGAPGTGSVTLLGAASGYRSFSAGIGNGNTTFYAIVDQNNGPNWEVGIGTYSSTGNTLSRTTVLASSNGGSLTNFSSGVQNVWVDYPAAQSVYGQGTILVAPSGALLPPSNGGTGQSNLPAAMAALQGFTTTATAAGTTTLTNTSTFNQVFTGSTTQTIVLPVTSTLSQGWTYQIFNNSTGNLLVQSSGGNSILTVLPNTSAEFVCILTSGTTAASWSAFVDGFSSTTGTGANVLQTSPTINTPTLTNPIMTGSTPQITIYTGSSGTYTVPTNTRYLTIEMCAGGGGGAGSGVSATGGAGGTGGTTTFGTSLLTSTGGLGGSGGASGGNGGSSTINSPAIYVVSAPGGAGVSVNYASSVAYQSGGNGSASPFGGNGGCTVASAGTAASGFGSAGGGAGCGATPAVCGGGGGAGGYIKAMITSPLSSYSYSVGAGGSAGTAGTSGFVGGAGGGGIIIVTAYF